MVNSSRTAWNYCEFDLPHVTCALEKLDMIDSDMNPDVAGIENINNEICSAWELAAMAGLVRRGCLRVGLERMIDRMSPLPPSDLASDVALRALTLRATIYDQTITCHGLQPVQVCLWLGDDQQALRCSATPPCRFK